MPSRILREGIISSPKIDKLSMGAEMFYRRLMSVADDYGRFYAEPVTLLGACWPTAPNKVCLADVKQWLSECLASDVQLLSMYEVNGQKYLQIIDFRQQTRSKSKFPEPANHLLSNCEAPVHASRSRSRISDAETETAASPHAHTHGNASPIEVEDGWGAFIAAWQDAGLIGASGPDWQSALEHWRHRMDISQRLGAVAHLASVTAESPVAKMLPLGYLRSQAWTRTAAQPRPAPVAQRPAPRGLSAVEIVQRRERELMEKKGSAT